MTAKRTYTFTDGKSLTLGERTLVMGILNVTPDSFSDGGKWNTRDKMLYHMEQMVKDGADIIDIGAESSRPGFTVMSADEEIERLLPFLDALIPECPVPVSVDTFKAQTARVAAEHGVHMLNDIWGMQYEKEPGKMAAVAAETLKRTGVRKSAVLKRTQVPRTPVCFSVSGSLPPRPSMRLPCCCVL